MKKILLIFLLLTLSFSTKGVFADQCSNSCKIKDTPAPVLQEYIDNNRKIILNISRQLIQNNTNSIMKQQWIKIYNSITNWNTFSTGIKMLKINLDWEVPFPVNRDMELLNKEGAFLGKFLQDSISNHSSDSPITNLCNGVDNCNLTDGSAWEILWKIIANHNNITEFYRLSLLWKESSFKWNITLTKTDFKSELNNFYNQYTLVDCSQCENGFLNIISKSITIISENFEESKDWIQQWKDAWNLLNGSKNPTAEYARLERELLQVELSKQWVGWNNGETLLKNLDRYNNNAYSNQNNPINNAFSNFEVTIQTNADGVNFASNVYQSVKQLYNKWASYLKWDTPTVPISVLTQIDSRITSATAIMEAVDNSYQKEVPFISAQDTNSDKLQARIIQMHIDLSQAINILDKTRAISEKVCNDQDRWNWRCKY